MTELYPYFTNDGSPGLYSKEADDIYHSAKGALTEAYEKFVLPSELDNFFMHNSEIKLLDICFGIGYNSKSFMNYFYQDILKIFPKQNKNHQKFSKNKFFLKFFSKLPSSCKNYIVPTHTDNIYGHNNFKI